VQLIPLQQAGLSEYSRTVPAGQVHIGIGVVDPSSQPPPNSAARAHRHAIHNTVPRVNSIFLVPIDLFPDIFLLLRFFVLYAILRAPQ
jgi:hypothetical protein